MCWSECVPYSFFLAESLLDHVLPIVKNVLCDRVLTSHLEQNSINPFVWWSISLYDYKAMMLETFLKGAVPPLLSWNIWKGVETLDVANLWIVDNVSSLMLGPRVAKVRFSSPPFALVDEDRMPGNSDCTPPLGHSSFTVCMQTRGWSWESIRAIPIIQQDKWFRPKRITPHLSIFPSLQVLGHLSHVMYEAHTIFENIMLWYKLWKFFKKYFVTHLPIKRLKSLLHA